MSAGISIEQAVAAATHLVLPGELRRLEPFGPGHIHASFHAVFGRPPEHVGVLLQCLNRHVFADPETLMRTVTTVTAHQQRVQRLRHPEDWRRRALRLVAAADGRLWSVDRQGEWWRAFYFIEGSRPAAFQHRGRQAWRLGTAFGTFLEDLAGLSEPLGVTLPGFHDPARRLHQLAAAAAADAAGRLPSCRTELRRIESHADLTTDFERLKPGLPGRIAHNDAKLDNLLVDDRDGAPLCVTDLDTVMQGLALFDFGELLRSAAGRRPEDDADAPAELRWETIERLAGGFVSAAPGLSPGERDSLALGPLLMTFENAVRFLTDHLEGDRYFKISRPGQNLARARAQLDLLEAFRRDRRRLAETVSRAASEENPRLRD